MKKVGIISVLCVPFVFGGCLTTRTQLRQDEQQTSLEKQVSTLKQSKADSEARFQDVDSQFRDMNGRVEVLEAKWTQLQKEKQDELVVDAKSKEDLDMRFKLLQEALEKQEKEIQELNLKVQNQSNRNAPTRVAQSPYHEGEKFFSQKKWKEAIVNYQKYREKYPKGKYYFDATYKIGVSFQELNLHSEAKPFYSEVIEKAPNTKLAKKAAYRLKSLTSKSSHSKNSKSVQSKSLSSSK